MTRLQFEAAAASKPRINFCGPEIEDEDVDKDKPCENILAKLKEQLASKDEMLNEAVFEYHTKSEELIKVQQENEQMLKELEETKEMLSDVQVFKICYIKSHCLNILLLCNRRIWNKVIYY
jgi:flagellar motility protein MotE (MotC chaperone)